MIHFVGFIRRLLLYIKRGYVVKIHDFRLKKVKREKISFVTCYDYTSAQIVAKSQIDGVLVGDSLAMTMYGHDTTIPASIELMAYHTAAVAKAANNKFIVGDLPFLSYRKSQSESMKAVQLLMQSGAHAIKLEGVAGNVDLIRHIVESGVPVMGHIGLTPQSVHGLGGFKVQGREARVADALLEQALLLETSGCFSIVLECVPSLLGQRISQALEIPTIGIGAGPDVDGQILVWQDLLGLQKEINIKFVKRYLNGFDLIQNALDTYHDEVCQAVYPDAQRHSYQ
jgi:3-methyl-2-oxobutanoate hydroxymethyltransferase